VAAYLGSSHYAVYQNTFDKVLECAPNGVQSMSFHASREPKRKLCKCIIISPIHKKALRQVEPSFLLTSFKHNDRRAHLKRGTSRHMSVTNSSWIGFTTCTSWENNAWKEDDDDNNNNMRVVSVCFTPNYSTQYYKIPHWGDSSLKSR